MDAVEKRAQEMRNELADLIEPYRKNPALVMDEFKREKVEHLISKLSKPMYEPIKPELNGGGSQLRVSDYETTSAPSKSVGHDRSFRSMFNLGRGVVLDNGGFRDATEFFNVIESQRFDPRLQKRAERANVIGIPSSGGFSVPTQFVSEWLDASLPNEITRQLAQLYPMQSESIKIPGWDADDFSSGEYAGLKMVFMAESAAADKQTAKMRQIQLNANMGTIYVDASLELVSDGEGFAAQLEQAMIKAIGFGIDRHCIGAAGTGAGCPLSIINSPCKIEIAGETGQATGTVNYKNLKKMFARQLNPEQAVFLINANSLPSMLEISIAIGTGGSFVPLLNEKNGEFRIFGRPCYITNHVPALGTAGCVSFVDFNFYALGMRQEIILDTTDAHRWTQRERSYRALIRFDGQITLDTYITPENGDTLSPVVTLAAI